LILKVEKVESSLVHSVSSQMAELTEDRRGLKKIMSRP